MEKSYLALAMLEERQAKKNKAIIDIALKLTEKYMDRESCGGFGIRYDKSNRPIIQAYAATKNFIPEIHRIMEDYPGVKIEIVRISVISLIEV